MGRIVLIAALNITYGRPSTTADSELRLAVAVTLLRRGADKY